MLLEGRIARRFARPAWPLPAGATRPLREHPCPAPGRLAHACLVAGPRPAWKLRLQFPSAPAGRLAARAPVCPLSAGTAGLPAGSSAQNGRAAAVGAAAGVRARYALAPAARSPAPAPGGAVPGRGSSAPVAASDPDGDPPGVALPAPGRAKAAPLAGCAGGSPFAARLPGAVPAPDRSPAPLPASRCRPPVPGGPPRSPR